MKILMMVLMAFLFQTNLMAQPVNMPTFIQPYDKCQLNPQSGEEVCTKLFVGGCAPEGLSFTEYGSCDVVKTQRPFYPKKPYAVTDPADKRLEDSEFVAEYQWVTDQVRSCGCVCCHDSKRDPLTPQTAGWDIAFSVTDGGKPSQIWTDHLSDRGVALFAGALRTIQDNGFYKAEENNGFTLERAAMPSNDIPRMTEFFSNELERRNISKETLDAMPPTNFIGGRMVARLLAQESKPCGIGVGIDKDLKIYFKGEARYIYIMKKDAVNPTAPPFHDLPNGTLWRIDRDHRLSPIKQPVRYGVIPEGMWQKFPAEDSEPEALVPQETYKLYVTSDVMRPIENCLFEF